MELKACSKIRVFDQDDVESVKSMVTLVFATLILMNFGLA